MTKYDSGEGLNMNPEQKPQHGVFPSSLNEKGPTTFGITTTPPLPETGKHYGDERDKVFEPSERTAPPERPKFWDKEPVKESLIQRMVNNLYLRLVLAGAGAYVAGYAVNEAYQNIPAVRQPADRALETVGLKAIVPSTFDNKAEATVLGRNNSFYVTPEEYKEKGPPTVEGERVNVPFFIRFNDGKERIMYIKKTGYAGGASWEISGDLQGGELLSPSPKDGDISIGGGNWGFPVLYKPGFSFSGWTITNVSGVDAKGRKFGIQIETGALQTSKDLNLQSEIYTVPGTDIKRPTNSAKGHIRGFASIGTLLDNKPVVIFSGIEGGLVVPTDISTTPTGQAYVLK